MLALRSFAMQGSRLPALIRRQQLNRINRAKRTPIIIVENVRSYTQMSNKDHRMLRPATPGIEQRHVPSELESGPKPNGCHKLKLDMHGFLPPNITVTTDGGCGVSIYAHRETSTIDGQHSEQDFEYDFSLPANADCDRVRAWFDLNQQEMLIETPWVGEPEPPGQSRPGMVAVRVQKIPVNTFGLDLDAPIEQKIPTPGEDEFPIDEGPVDKKDF